MNVIELNHVALAVNDVEAAVRFYRDVLGLQPLPRPAFDFPGAWFRLGTRQELHLIGGRKIPLRSGFSQDGHFALLLGDIDPVVERFRAAGVKMRPGRRPDGAHQVFVADPDGNVIELCSHLPS